MKLCVNFEGSTADGLNATVDASGIAFMTRQSEQAGRFITGSTYKVLDDQRLDIPNQLTIAMWIQPSELPPMGGDEQFGLFDAYGQYQLNYERDLDIECDLGNDDRLDARIPYNTLGTWRHVACTYDGERMKVYINGRVQGCRNVTRTLSTAGTLGAAIGANIADTGALKNGFVGELDNVHLFARALTAQQICDAWGYGNCNDSCPNGNQGSGNGS